MTAGTLVHREGARGTALAWGTLPAPVRQLLTFAAIGVGSTLAYVALYTILREGVGAALANAAALVVTAVGNTAANRRLTFRVTGRERLARDHAAGLAAFAAALAITTGALFVLAAIAPHAGRAIEIAMLVAANGIATLLRFVLLRRAIGRAGTPVVAPDAAPADQQCPPEGALP